MWPRHEIGEAPSEQRPGSYPVDLTNEEACVDVDAIHLPVGSRADHRLGLRALPARAIAGTPALARLGDLLSRRGTRGPRAFQAALVSVVLLAVGGCWDGDGGGKPISPPVATEPMLRSGPEVKYVSPDGSDVTDAKGTKRDPWRTLRYALPQLNPGQLLYVREGTYREELRRLVLNQGLADERIVVQAYPGERVLVRGLVWLREPSYWTFDGLDVTWDTKLADPPPHMVKITGGVGWTWTNSEIWGAEVAGRVGACRFVGLPFEQWRLFGGLANCAWISLDRHRSGAYWRIETYNAVAGAGPRVTRWPTDFGPPGRLR